MRIIVIVGLLLASLGCTKMPDARVYKLSRTPNGELYVHCLNGGDATIRPVEEFGSIVVSCGE